MTRTIPHLARIAAAGALVALAAGCTVPYNLLDVVNRGAVEHSAQHMAAGEPGSLVLCAVLRGDGRPPQGWLVRSDRVQALGCLSAVVDATATMCAETGLPADATFEQDILCTVLDHAPGTVPILQASDG